MRCFSTREDSLISLNKKLIEKKKSLNQMNKFIQTHEHFHRNYDVATPR